MNLLNTNEKINTILVGTVISEKRFSHMVSAEVFYNFDLEVERLSGIKDIIPVTISDFVLKKYR